jgi:hypothetical protein
MVVWPDESVAVITACDMAPGREEGAAVGAAIPVFSRDPYPLRHRCRGPQAGDVTVKR